MRTFNLWFDFWIGLMLVPTEAKLLDVACDVVVRLRGHGSYGTTEAALVALRRRVPGHTPGEYQAVLDFFIMVYERAVVEIASPTNHRPGKATGFAKFEDIDHAACMAALVEIEPGVALREKRQILNWCIFWHYLK